MFTNNFKKKKGNKGEETAKNFLVKNGYVLLEQNFFIRWGELDLIMEKNNEIVFVEVKVVDFVSDLYDYISFNKIKNLKKTIDVYIQRNEITKPIRLDFIFISKGEILERYKGIDYL